MSKVTFIVDTVPLFFSSPMSVPFCLLVLHYFPFRRWKDDVVVLPDLNRTDSFDDARHPTRTQQRRNSQPFPHR
ncbi:hypothetical protein GE061_008522 [Apolygus lucorum]|uniref:Uncharacterized protein n=1 Tax=Apolygus lucorum TaxID=248454 RepID=A0A8S9WMS4_APOLU|nr:hypothetical protein GE061_008522 [Apolygus lucorum]